MKLGDMLFEAKLTESDFQSAEASVLRGYRDFEEVFDEEELPREGEKLASYQLIRNVLAAYASDCGFCVLVDARRPDLIESWYAILRCVRPVELRVRCKVLTWQELCVGSARAAVRISGCQVRHRRSRSDSSYRIQWKRVRGGRVAGGRDFVVDPSRPISASYKAHGT